MQHRIRCSTVGMPKHFLNMISSTHPAQGAKQPPFTRYEHTEAQAQRNIQPSLQPPLSLIGSFQLRGRWTIPLCNRCSSRWRCASKSTRATKIDVSIARRTQCSAAGMGHEDAYSRFALKRDTTNTTFQTQIGNQTTHRW